MGSQLLQGAPQILQKKSKSNLMSKGLVAKSLSLIHTRSLTKSLWLNHSEHVTDLHGWHLSEQGFSSSGFDDMSLVR